MNYNKIFKGQKVPCVVKELKVGDVFEQFADDGEYRGRWKVIMPPTALWNGQQMMAIDPFPEDDCCENEQRSMAGGCVNCGAPCF